MPANRRVLGAGAIALGLASSLLIAGQAHAFCRTTTCRLPADFSPSADQCYPPDFVAQCAALTPSAKVLPLYWGNACVSYDVQKDASAQIPYETAVTVVDRAFAKWTSATCLSASGTARAGLDASNKGPVDCALVQYNSDQGNQHVIVFRDHPDPNSPQHFGGSNTLGLTTVTFNPETGEIYDADTEINATVMLSLGDPVNGYDLDSIITHEVGHFLGLAHSADGAATMFAQYTPGSTSMRTLTADDAAGLCSIYPGNGNRNVDPSVAANGQIAAAACDPTPRHGFSQSCAQPLTNKSCTVAAGAPGAASSTASFWVVGLGALGVARRRWKRRGAPRTR